MRNVFEKVITHQAKNFDIESTDNMGALSVISKEDVMNVLEIGR